MNHIDMFKVFISMFTMNLPTLAVCLVAVIVVLTRWKQASRGALWALSGFGLALGLCVVIPVVQTILQPWVFQNGSHAQRMWVFSLVSGVWSVLHGAAYALLLVAVFAGRSAPDPVARPLVIPPA